MVNPSFSSLRKLGLTGHVFEDEGEEFPHRLHTLVLHVDCIAFSGTVMAYITVLHNLSIKCHLYESENERFWKKLVAGLSMSYPNLVELSMESYIPTSSPEDTDVHQMKDTWLLPLGSLALKRLRLVGFHTFVGGFLAEGQFHLLEKVEFCECDDVMLSFLRLVKQAKVSLSIVVFPYRDNCSEFCII